MLILINGFCKDVASYFKANLYIFIIFWDIYIFETFP